MPVSQRRLNELKSSGYKYHFTNDIYINTSDKVIISKEAIDDHDDTWLNQQLTTCDGNKWLLIFTEGRPSDEVQDKILKDLGLI